jgi:hypothetical protein
MERTIIHTLVIGVFAATAAACAPVVPTATPNTQATINAAVAAIHSCGKRSDRRRHSDARPCGR